MTAKNGIIGLILVALIGFGAWYLFINAKSLPHTLNENGDRVIKEDAEFYTIQAVYPNTTRLGTRTDTSEGANERAVNRIEAMVEDAVATFKREANRNLTEAERTRLSESGLKYALSIGYVPYNSGDFASFEFDVYEDLGGAHPNTYYKTLVFDLEGNEVALEDLFTSGSNYLGRIAEIARTQIETQLEGRAGVSATTTIIAEGLSPTAQNFANWVDNDGMLMFFIPPSQVAAHAAGSFDVRIPLTQLQDILKPGVQ